MALSAIQDATPPGLSAANRPRESSAAETCSSSAAPGSWGRCCSACCSSGFRTSGGPTSWCAAARGPTARRGSGRAWSPLRLFDPLRESLRGRRGAGGDPAPEGGRRRRRHRRAEPGALRGGGREGRQGHRRPHQLVGAGDVQPAAGVGAAHQRRGDQERHRLRQADEAAGADSHQHLLRGRKPLGRRLGRRGAGRVLPAKGAAGDQVLRRAGDLGQRGRRGPHPPAGRRRPGAGPAAPGGARAAARGEPRSRRRGGAEAGGRPGPQGSGSAPR